MIIIAFNSIGQMVHASLISLQAWKTGKGGTLCHSSQCWPCPTDQLTEARRGNGPWQSWYSRWVSYSAGLIISISVSVSVYLYPSPSAVSSPSGSLADQALACRSWVTCSLSASVCYLTLNSVYLNLPRMTQETLDLKPAEPSPPS